VSSVPPPSAPAPPPFSHRPELPDGLPPEHVQPPAAPSPSPSPSDLAAAPWWAPFVAMFVSFAAAFVLVGLAAGAAALGGVEVTGETTPPGILIPGQLLASAAMIAFVWLFARMWVSGVRPSTLGIRPTPFWPAVGWTLLALVTFLVAAALYTAVLGKPPDQTLVDDLRDERSVLVLAGFALMVAVGAPLGEEILFRGFLFGVLREKLPLVGAALIGGTVFGLVHIAGSPVQTLGVLVFLGILFCLLYAKTGSILPGMALHAVNNSIAFIATTKPPEWVWPLVLFGSVAVVVGLSSLAIARERRTA